MTRLACCTGAEAERFNRTTNHATVQCFVCLRSFCLDARDVRTELEHRPTKLEPRQGRARRWYCSNACQARRYDEEAAASTEARKARATRASSRGGIATETRDERQNGYSTRGISRRRAGLRRTEEDVSRTDADTKRKHRAATSVAMARSAAARQCPKCGRKAALRRTFLDEWTGTISYCRWPDCGYESEGTGYQQRREQAP